MQETRRYILDILRSREHATVDELVDDLQKLRGNITAVTVRHHLMRLQEEGFISSPQMRHRSAPGRPQHVYALTDQASGMFPNNYQRFARGLLRQLQAQLPVESVNVILEGVANDMVSEADLSSTSMDERLTSVVNYLNQRGYIANWEAADGGYVLHTHNCPYHNLMFPIESLCYMDMRLISRMMGIVPRLVSHIAAGDTSCSYFIPDK